MTKCIVPVQQSTEKAEKQSAARHHGTVFHSQCAGWHESWLYLITFIRVVIAVKGDTFQTALGFKYLQE